jgi:hypothetical protein
MPSGWQIPAQMRKNAQEIAKNAQKTPIFGVFWYSPGCFRM